MSGGEKGRKHYEAAPVEYPDKVRIELGTDNLGEAFELFRQFRETHPNEKEIFPSGWFMFEVGPGPIETIVARYTGANWIISDQMFGQGAAMVARAQPIIHSDRFVPVSSLKDYRDRRDEYIRRYADIDWEEHAKRFGAKIW
jgi:superoxide dismutase